MLLSNGDQDVSWSLITPIFVSLLMARAFWGSRKMDRPRRFFYLSCIFSGSILMFFAAQHATIPSDAPRTQITGRFAGIEAHGFRSSREVTFNLYVNGRLLPFKNEIELPQNAYNQDVLVTYLDEDTPDDRPRVVAAQVLTGPSEGYRTSVSADWDGPWILFPIGILIILGSIALEPRKS